MDENCRALTMPNAKGVPCSIGSMIAVVFLMQGMPALAKEDAVCPDMSGHEQTLNEGEQYFQEHGGSGSSGFGFPDVGWEHHTEVEEDSPFANPSFTFAGIKMESPRQKRMLSDSRLQKFPKDHPELKEWSKWFRVGSILEQIDDLPLKTTTQIESAELGVRELAAATEYDAAQRLLQRILAARIRVTPNDRGDIEAIRDDIRRITMIQAASAYEKDKQLPAALSNYNLVIESIDSARDLDLAAKLAFLSPVSSRLDKIGADGNKEARQLQLKVADLCTGYRRSLDCIHMAERLDANGWRLEKAGMTEMAQKAFKESLEIKTKNLGQDDPDTLAAYGDQARLCADEGHFAEAQDIYERTLAKYRKLQNRGTPYASMLESYGDMLNRMGHTAKANAIYAEARNYYKTIKGN
jgi:tetratricopeptide (TPR) repeat protein